MKADEFARETSKFVSPSLSSPTCSLVRVLHGTEQSSHVMRSQDAAAAAAEADGGNMGNRRRIGCGLVRGLQCTRMNRLDGNLIRESPTDRQITGRDAAATLTASGRLELHDASCKSLGHCDAAGCDANKL
ncbi:hypothetical protein E4U16_001826 [Claviceps sp. LM84 group G4]|nr:hypothetical protein E4U16_001826 [Claviceps sp. LM84 group G4]